MPSDDAALLLAVIQDLLNEAAFHAPIGLADPIEISHDDRVKAEALREYADRLRKHSSMTAVPAPAVEREALIRLGAKSITPAYGKATIAKATAVVDALISAGVVHGPVAQAAMVPVTLVPVEVFGGDCGCHDEREHGQGKSDCHGWSYGLMDAVQAWSDCNRATGHLYRVDDTDPQYRNPGETITVFVPADQVSWFKRTWAEDALAGHAVAEALSGPSVEGGEQQ